ncbi:AMSH-like ubiquitin thioesterase 1 [Papaver somniferum]|uniref:AMSH-like ubiquitin thioesterase 1 n=1 Tax=Papaver somniferum TaxID=3469 RepID=UPI000E70281B|nr:AMSH-like ubiquitin thioesterase 1 [Papaver somniferum]
MKRSTSGAISVADSAQKLPVENRISLRFYYRIADNLLRQAAIFRAEKNIIDLYIMLLRFSSLIVDTIPCHKDYQFILQRERQSFGKRLLNVLSELESLKPEVQLQINELNRKRTIKENGRDAYDPSLEWPPAKNQARPNYEIGKIPRSVGRGSTIQNPLIQRDKCSYGQPVEEQFRKFNLTVPRPSEETLSKHSIFGPNGLSGQWQPPKSNTRVEYPSNLDFTPIEIPSLQQPLPMIQNGSSNTESGKSTLEAVLSLNNDSQPLNTEEPRPMISLDAIELPTRVEIVRQPSPPPVLADVHDLIPASSPQVTEAGCGMDSLPDELARSKSPLELHISTAVMETFLRLASSNTKRNLETCGVLAGLLKNRKFYVSALIIPKQESTSDTCQTTNEEEIFDVQDKQSLFPLGWIHTHPTQSCFMSSVDVHTHYSYQIMLPEAIAIVMAPKDSSRKYGIFRLTSPGGMSVIRKCPQRGFHTHQQPPDGGPIYDQCTEVYMNPSMKFDIIDLR